jgi:filamentous hemagglutinin family protein
VVLADASSLAVFFMQSAAAQVSVSSGNTQAYSGLNGVTVDIATANANGLSHNKYNQFNVDAKGLVLNNNALTSPIQSNLAGQVERNMNLNAAAKVILNEVVMQKSLHAARLYGGGGDACGCDCGQPLGDYLQRLRVHQYRSGHADHRHTEYCAGCSISVSEPTRAIF